MSLASYNTERLASSTDTFRQLDTMVQNKRVFEQDQREGGKNVYEKKEEKTFIILLYVFSGKQFGTNNLFLKVICRKLHLQC